MSLSEKVMDALKSGILLNERVTSLLSKVERIDEDLRRMNDRLVRLETVVEIAQSRSKMIAPNKSSD